MGFMEHPVASTPALANYNLIRGASGAHSFIYLFKKVVPILITFAYGFGISPLSTLILVSFSKVYDEMNG